MKAKLLFPASEPEEPRRLAISGEAFPPILAGAEPTATNSYERSLRSLSSPASSRVTEWPCDSKPRATALASALCLSWSPPAGNETTAIRTASS